MKTGKERQTQMTDKGKAIKMLQDPLLEGLIDNTINNGVRQAIIILVHILNAKLEKNNGMDWLIMLI